MNLGRPGVGMALSESAQNLSIASLSAIPQFVQGKNIERWKNLRTPAGHRFPACGLACRRSWRCTCSPLTPAGTAHRSTVALRELPLSVAPVPDAGPASGFVPGPPNQPLNQRFQIQFPPSA